MDPINHQLCETLRNRDLARADQLLLSGANINAHTDCGESLLKDLIGEIWDQAGRVAVVQFMLEHGADPRLLTSEGSGPLFAAVLAQDTEVVRLLLGHGADPNREHDLGEPLYDWAEFDYRYEAFGLNLPEEPDEADRTSADTRLQFLDRLAIKHSKRRPDYLFLLRRHGALTYAEQRWTQDNEAYPRSPSDIDLREP